MIVNAMKISYLLSAIAALIGASLFASAAVQGDVRINESALLGVVFANTMALLLAVGGGLLIHDGLALRKAKGHWVLITCDSEAACGRYYFEHTVTGDRREVRPSNQPLTANAWCLTGPARGYLWDRQAGRWRLVKRASDQPAPSVELSTAKPTPPKR